MTKGSPWRLIAGFALPVLLSQIFQQLYNTADTLIVGRFLGDGALAAVSSSGPLIFLLVSFVEGLTLGAGVAISRYFGAGDDASVERAIHTNIVVSFLSGVFCPFSAFCSRRRSFAGWAPTLRFCRRPSHTPAITLLACSRSFCITPAKAS